MSDKRKLISVVTPCYNEEGNVRECYEAVKKVFSEELPEYDYEHIFCDNTSTDQTLDILREIAAEDKNIKVIINARNVGPFRSVFNGMMHASGDGVLACLPADIQDPPEHIVTFVRKWEEGYDVVYGARRQREESALMIAIRRIFYSIVAKCSDFPIPENVGEFQFLDKKVVDCLHKFEDHYPYIRGMIAYCGFKKTGFEYVWKARKSGFSKNRFYNLIDMALNGIISFSKVPLRICMLSGVLLSGISGTIALL